MRGLVAVNGISAMAGQQFFHRENHVPSWFIRFVNSNVLFTGIPTIAIVALMIVLRLISRGEEGPRWTDFDFGLPLVVGAIVAVPAATTLRVAKEVFARAGTRPRSTVEISIFIVVALVIMAVVLARAAGARRSVDPGEIPTTDDLAFGLFIPNLAGIFAVMLVLLFAAPVVRSVDDPRRVRVSNAGKIELGVTTALFVIVGGGFSIARGHIAGDLFILALAPLLAAGLTLLAWFALDGDRQR